ncbi:Farnesyl pyrophosphate synthetase [Sorochytrium milnesiophthora]
MSIAEAFKASYDKLAKELLDDLATINAPTEAVAHMQKVLVELIFLSTSKAGHASLIRHAYGGVQMLDHNVKGGKMNRGLAVIDTLTIIAEHQGRKLSETEVFKAHVLGWAVEWACFLVADDIMDQSLTRRGKPCWYRVEGVGYNAVNDAFLLESHIFRMIKKHFKTDAYYGDLLDLIHDVAYLTECGQLVDMITAPEGDVNLDRFSLSRHQWIVIHKTSYYSFYLSVAMAFLLGGVTSDAAFAQAKAILLPLGEYFQVQDDYLDAFADPKVLGKVGTDIQDNKCSWLVNTALAKCSAEQRAVLDSSYGRKGDAAAEARVKQLYKDLKLDELFAQYEEDSYVRLTGMINGIDASVGVPKDVYTSFMQKIYKRSM